MLKIRVITLISCLLITFSATAINCKKITGKGRFYSKDDDSLDFVKKELLYDAFRNLLTQKMDCMGLDSKTFWEKFDVAFEKSFEDTAKSIKDSYTEVDESGNEKIKNQDEYEKKLRINRLASKRRFGHLDRLITSYSIKKMSRSTQYPNSRYLSLNAKVNSKALGNLYYKYTESKEARFIDQVIVSANVELKELSWHELGVKVETEFVNALKKSWQKFIDSNWGRYFNQSAIPTAFVIAELEKMNTFENVSGFSVDVEPKKIIDATTGEIKMIPGGSQNLSNNALWVSFYVKIKKLKDNQVLKKKIIEFSGHYIIKDLMTGEVVGHYDFPKESKEYYMEESENFASGIASYIYRIPIVSLSADSKKISTLTSNENMVVLELRNISSVKDILEFNNKIANKGIRFQLRPKLESYDGDHGKITVYYRGASVELKNFLITLKNSDVSEERKLDFVTEDNPYVFKLIKNEKGTN